MTAGFVFTLEERGRVGLPTEGGKWLKQTGMEAYFVSLDLSGKAPHVCMEQQPFPRDAQKKGRRCMRQCL